MKRTIPLLITAAVGLILIASRFIPIAESWGEVGAIWFDILAAVAFVLGGGNLLKLQLKKISDRSAGWGYAAIILISFVATLYAGFSKVGSQPAAQQEFYGQSFAHLDVADLPASTIARVTGLIPKRPDGEELPLSVKRQLREEDGQLVFHGWMTPRQQADLADYQDSLSWQCAVENLFDASQPQPPLKGKVQYLADHSALSARGMMSPQVRDALLALGGDERWKQAVDLLFKAGQRESRVAVQLPAGYHIPTGLRDAVFYDQATHELGIRGPMSTAVRDELAKGDFPLVHPLSAEARSQFGRELDSRGSALNAVQARTLDEVLQKTWVVDKLRVALDEAGKAVPVEKTPCDLEEERTVAAGKLAEAHAAPDAAGAAKSPGPDLKLNARQQAELDRFAADPAMTPAKLAEQLRALGPFNDRQAAALEEFFSRTPTVGDQRLDLCVKLLREGPLSRKQYEYLVDEYRAQERWRQTVGRLFVAAHVVKYPWSGQYNTETSAFGWLYEFAFNPLQATMFSLLAFYVASAAFRAFRAKNVEASLLLGTAFIILLGQTFAGYWLTAWIPVDSRFAIFRIDHLTQLVAVFLTAGGRAIMIGIALGVAATSLKVLLGIDRSYLGTGKD